MEKLEAEVEPLDVAVEADPPPHILNIRSPMDAGTPSPRISRTKVVLLTVPDPGVDSRLCPVF